MKVMYSSSEVSRWAQASSSISAVAIIPNAPGLYGRYILRSFEGHHVDEFEGHHVDESEGHRCFAVTLRRRDVVVHWARWVGPFL